MHPKYSVIIPVFNAEGTINRCIDSLLTQNCDDVEIILVNDGSQDASGEICEEYAQAREHIRYITQQNGGVSAARNTGLDAAQGEYILFVDSDDYVSETLFSDLRKVIDTHPVDLFQFPIVFVGNGQTNRQRILSGDYLDEDLENAIQQAICNKSLNSPCAKVYRRELIDDGNIRFPLGLSVGEDRIFNMEYALQIHSYSVSEVVGYYANLENTQSLSRRENNMALQNCLYDDAFKSMIAHGKGSAKRKEMLCQANNFGMCRSIFHEARRMIQNHVGWFTRQKLIGELCDEINRKQLTYPKTQYCSLITFPIRFRLTCLIDAMMLYYSKRGSSLIPDGRKNAKDSKDRTII